MVYSLNVVIVMKLRSTFNRLFRSQLVKSISSVTFVILVVYCFGGGLAKAGVSSTEVIPREDAARFDRVSEEGMDALIGQDYVKAIARFEEAVSLRPGYPIATHNLAIAYNNYAMMLPPPQALMYLRKAIRLEPNNPRFQNSYTRCSQWHNAQPAPNSALAATHALELRKNGNTRAAISELTNAIKMNSIDPNLYAMRSLAESDLMEYTEAINDINKAISLEPDIPNWITIRDGLCNLALLAECEKLYFGKVFGGVPDELRLQRMERPLFGSVRVGPFETRIMPIARALDVSPAFADKWALIIGITHFAHSEYNLRFAAKDAQDFYNFLVNEAHFKPDHVLLLTDHDATASNIKRAFGDKWLPRVCGPQDLAVVYVSTHGTPAKRDKGGKNYLVAYDTDGADLYATGIEMDELSQRMRESVKSERVLVILDACYSGSAARKSSVPQLSDNFDVNDLVRGMGKGRLVISSSSPQQTSWESKNYSNGIFTHALIDALRKNNTMVDVRNAFGDIKQQVDSEVRRDCGTEQTPQMAGEWSGREFILALPASRPRKLQQ
jgi:tetratricopeptide (TPR) repeat protein